MIFKGVLCMKSGMCFLSYQDLIMFNRIMTFRFETLSGCKYFTLNLDPANTKIMVEVLKSMSKPAFLWVQMEVLGGQMSIPSVFPKCSRPLYPATTKKKGTSFSPQLFSQVIRLIRLQFLRRLCCFSMRKMVSIQGTDLKHRGYCALCVYM